MGSLIKLMIAIALLMSPVTGCGNQTTPNDSTFVPNPDAKNPSSTGPNTEAPVSPLPSVDKPKLPRPDHIVIVIEENKAYESMIGDKKATAYINELAQQGVLLTNYYAIEHPSEPNYLDLFSGSNQGVRDDSCPHTFTSDNLGSELIAKGFTFGGYSEGLPSVGYSGCSKGAYKRKHNPWVNFSNLPASVNMPLTDLPADYSKLPTVSIVVPNQDNDMHDGPVSQADQWLRQKISPYVQWAATHNSLLVVTWDEDDNSKDNHIPAIFVGPMVKPGQYADKLNHFNLLRTLTDIYGLSPLGNSKNVEPIAKIWAQ